ncbi:MAG: hypothetical protein WBD10_02790 [Acidobacteriaceae bacterium]
MANAPNQPPGDRDRVAHETRARAQGVYIHPTQIQTQPARPAQP